MSEPEIVSIRGGFGPLAEELARLVVRDFTPVMGQIKEKYMRSMASAAWSGSGLHSITGELQRAITPFAGKTSVGVGLRTRKGKDLVLAKAYTQTFGRKKGANKRGINRKTGKPRRRSPWGDIPARPFMPDTLPSAYREDIEQMIVGFISDRLGR